MAKRKANKTDPPPKDLQELPRIVKRLMEAVPDLLKTPDRIRGENFPQFAGAFTLVLFESGGS